MAEARARALPGATLPGLHKGWTLIGAFVAILAVVWVFIALEIASRQNGTVIPSAAYYGAGVGVTALVAVVVGFLIAHSFREARSSKRLLDAQAALERSEARLRAIFDQAAVGIGMRSLDGRWLRVNKRLCDILGCTPDQVLANRFIDESAGLAVEMPHVRPDGVEVWVHSATALVVDSEDKPDCLIAVVEDITARKEAERQASLLTASLEERVLQRTAELAEANKGLESFSYSVSHDLRTPLRAISGFAQILARRHRTSLNEEGRHYMDNIVRASAQMGKLIEDLLGYSRLGRRTVRMTTVELADVLGEVMSALAHRISETRGSVDVPATLPAVRGDTTLIFQILSNLLENALTYCKPGAAPRVQVRCRAEGSRVVLSVRDEGIGIAKEHFDTVFGVFQRLHDQDRYPGTGIGLATVKRAASLLGGSISLESTVGEATTFHVHLTAA